MGLDFSHCSANWAYSGFNRFRIKLATQLGIPLSLMEGFYCEGEVIKDNYCIDEIKKSLPLKWSNFKKKPIYDFLNHSDCDGHLTSNQCKKIYLEIEKLIKNWDEDDYDTQQAIELIEGMKSASEKKENLEFC